MSPPQRISSSLDGHMIPHGSFQFTRTTGAATYEGTIGSVTSYDDSVGHGLHDIYDGDGHLVSHDDTSSHGLGIGLSAKGAATVPLWGGEFKANLTFQEVPFVDSLLYKRPGFLETFGDTSRDAIDEFGLHWKGPVGPLELETLLLQRLDHNNSTSDSFDGTHGAAFRLAERHGAKPSRAPRRAIRRCRS